MTSDFDTQKHDSDTSLASDRTIQKTTSLDAQVGFSATSEPSRHSTAELIAPKRFTGWKGTGEDSTVRKAMRKAEEAAFKRGQDSMKDRLAELEAEKESWKQHAHSLAHGQPIDSDECETFRHITITKWIDDDTGEAHYAYASGGMLPEDELHKGLRVVPLEEHQKLKNYADGLLAIVEKAIQGVVEEGWSQDLERQLKALQHKGEAK